jgi:hypothetical protein
MLVVYHTSSCASTFSFKFADQIEQFVSVEEYNKPQQNFLLPQRFEATIIGVLVQQKEPQW